MIDLILILLISAIPTAIAVGGPGTKVAWYAATGAFLFFVDILISAVFIALKTTRVGDAAEWLGYEPLISALAIVLCGIVVILLASATGKRCQACRSRIEKRALRCPKCHESLVPTLVTATSPSIPVACHSCNTSLAIGTRFCSKCGAAVPSVSY